MAGMAEGAEMRVPPSIPLFIKRHRPYSRLSNDWLSSPSFTDDLLDDLPFCPKSKPMEEDLTAFQARTSTQHKTPLRTSTPYMSTTLDLFNLKSQMFQQDGAASLAKVSLDRSRDSGRWSMDTAEAEEMRLFAATPLPKISLEKSFDDVLHEDLLSDSAYESEFFSQDTELASSGSSLLEARTVVSSESHLDQILDTIPETANVDRLQEKDDDEDVSMLPETPINAVIKKVLKPFTPAEPDRLIGRRMGREHVDIISELSVRNMSTVLTQIFEGVDCKDLCSVKCVSKSWKSACDSDKSASERCSEAKEKHWLRNVELQKENITVRRSPRNKRGLTQGTVLGNVQATGEEVCSKKNLTTPSQGLWQNEADKLRQDQELRKCSQCNSPAKTFPAQDRAVCVKCAYDFCTNCGCVFHGSSNCSITLRKKSKTEPTAGTRKSKKSLRRL